MGVKQEVKLFYNEVKDYIEEEVFMTEQNFIDGTYTFDDQSNEILIKEFFDVIIFLIGKEAFGAHFVEAYKRRGQFAQGAREAIVWEAFIKAKEMLEK